MPRANQAAASFSCGLDSGVGIGVLVTTFSRAAKIHHKLSRDRLQQLALVAERHAMLVSGRSAGLEQRISHARRLLLHGFERLPDHRRPYPHGAQVANFLDFQQVGKGVGDRGTQSTPRAPSWPTGAA